MAQRYSWPKGRPITIRGETFATIQDCAWAFDINTQAIYRMLDEGRADMIGTGTARPGNKGVEKPITIHGFTWPSRKHAAAALGYSNDANLYRALKENPDAIRRRMIKFLQKRIAEK